jgi:sporulation protein YqfC
MQDKNKKDFKEKFTELFVLPKEILLDLPKISIVGNQQIFIENYKGIVEYDSEKIRINCTKGLIKIFGNNLEINTVTSEEVYITGRISNIEFSE